VKYLLTGGGTGGHVYPALAIADEIRRQEPESRFLYVGVRRRLESRVVPGKGYPLRFVRSRPFPRTVSLAGFALFGLTLVVGVMSAMLILMRFRPDVIICTGGFVSAPVMFAFGILRKLGLSRAKVFLYEPNAHPGLLNHAVGRLADRIGLAFEQAGRWFDMKRVAIVGYPVRREFLEVDREGARQRLGIPADRQVVVAVGGSSGARVINEALVVSLPRLRRLKNIMILHVTGRYNDAEYDAVANTARHLERLGITGDTSSWYRRYDYMEDLQDAYGAADLIICRGGAGTLTEVSVCGRPSIIVPLATAAEDHQAFNARELAKRGAARVLYQEASWVEGRVQSIVSPTRLADLVSELLDSPRVLGEMATASQAVPRRDSLELILGEISSLVVGRRPPPLTLEFPLRQEGLPSDPNALLRAVKGRIADAGGVAGLDPLELSYLRYRADCYLASEAWYEIPLGRRNVGVKLVGLLQYSERVDVILSILQDTTKTSWVRRICGGDFHHPGILRRNAVELGIRLQEEVDDSIRDVLLQALATDPYFEVRAAAACELGRRFFESCDQIEAALLRALESERSSRVTIQVIKALGRIGRGPAVLSCFRSFYLHPDWQFRHEVVSAIRRLLERRVLDPSLVAEDVDRVLDASPGFEPAFPLKDSLRELAEEVTAATDGGPRLPRAARRQARGR
jgi:UDP-N-acetylglucosamine--N-acetylmuramyl-(pentapeptide) pyrophosphoryl-undecaprenol N-acetylglucosamine transferase